MTKKMIDVEAINRLLAGIIKRGFYNIMGVEYSIDVAVLQNIKHKINELATPAPQNDTIKAIEEFGDHLDGQILRIINRVAEETHSEIYDKIHNKIQKIKNKGKGGNHE